HVGGRAVPDLPDRGAWNTPAGPDQPVRLPRFKDLQGWHHADEREFRSVQRLQQHGGHAGEPDLHASVHSEFVAAAAVRGSFAVLQDQRAVRLLTTKTTKITKITKRNGGSE